MPRDGRVRVPRKTLPNLAVAAAIAVSLGLALSGCVATAGNLLVHAAASNRVTTATRDKPHTGECWQGDFADNDGYANWSEGPPVSCSGPHDLYTYVVAPLTETHKGKLFDKKGYTFD